MADIFGRTSQFGGSMSADATRMTLAGLPNTGLIIQNVSIGYSQTISRLYALEDGKVYFVAGRTDGQAELQHVIGPKGFQEEFFRLYGNVCNIKGALVFTSSTGCGQTSTGVAGVIASSKISLTSPVISSVNIQVNANDMIIGEGMRLMFVSLDMSSLAAAA